MTKNKTEGLDLEAARLAAERLDEELDAIGPETEDEELTDEEREELEELSDEDAEDEDSDEDDEDGDDDEDDEDEDEDELDDEELEAEAAAVVAKALNKAGPNMTRLALIGLGHIGGSIALAARRAGVAGHIAGYARSAETRAKAEELGLVDSLHETAAEAAEGADLVILCVPVGAMAKVAAEIAPSLAPDAILSDVGSVKGAVVEAVAPLVPQGVHFVPAHPLAGTEHSGPESAFAELFDGRWAILTPPEGTDPEAVAVLRGFWEKLGANVDEMTVEHHDRALALISHLPHAIAYTIVGTAADAEDVSKSEIVKYSASGFRDFTRIAASDPVMWRDIFLNNREALLEAFGRLEEDLVALRRAIRSGDGEYMLRHFERTREIRKGIVQAGQDVAAANFGRPHGTSGRKAPSPRTAESDAGRSFRPREGGYEDRGGRFGRPSDSGDRPRRFDREDGERGGYRGGGDRPFRKPFGGGGGFGGGPRPFGGPNKSFWRKDDEGGRPPRRDGEGGDRPFRPREDGDRPFRKPFGGGDRPFRPREGGEGGDRPFRKPFGGGDRPFRPREGGEGGDRPFRKPFGGGGFGGGGRSFGGPREGGGRSFGGPREGGFNRGPRDDRGGGGFGGPRRPPFRRDDE